MKDMDMSKERAVNPRDPQRTPAYIYIKPPPQKELHNPDRLVVVYEAHDPGARQIAVGFADGHVEVLNEDAFKKAMEAK